jgi:hypothetical protein
LTLTDAQASASLRRVSLTTVVLTFVTLAAATPAQLPGPAPTSAVRVNSVLGQDGNLQIKELRLPLFFIEIRDGD